PARLGSLSADGDIALTEFHACARDHRGGARGRLQNPAVEELRAQVATAEGVPEDEGQVVGVDQRRDVDDRSRHRGHLAPEAVDASRDPIPRARPDVVAEVGVLVADAERLARREVAGLRGGDGAEVPAQHGGWNAWRHCSNPIIIIGLSSYPLAGRREAATV